MKRLCTVVGMLATAHLLGVLAFAGWLFGTDRLSEARIEAVRLLLREPVPVEAARLEAERAAAEAEAAKQPAPLPPTPPLPSDQLVSVLHTGLRAEEFRNQRLERETEDLVRTLSLERARLDRDRKEFEEERRSFLEMRKDLEEMEGEEQFQDAVAVLKEIKPASAKVMLQELIEGGANILSGSDGDGMTRAVAYLDALMPDIRAPVMEQFAKDEPQLAATLLERLRTFGLVAEDPGATPP